jgi:hypothetical protein
MNALPFTRTVNTHELRVGDRVFTHGEVFELTGKYTPDARDVDDAEGFYTKLVESFWQEIPRHWIDNDRGGWHIQGNARARWAKVIP